ncbi:MAG: amidohydrolase family protein [Clostridia bacterium]|nr:amidohydrolase family protein [Clostridia bacterium]
MVVDFHTHIFPDKIAKATIDFLSRQANIPPYTDGTDEGLLLNMEKGGIDIAVSLPVLTKPSQFDSINNFALKINAKYADKKRKIISFGGIHPLCEDIKGKMLFLKNAGLTGVKIHPDYQGEYIDHDGYKEILKCAKELDMVVVTHAGVDYGFPNSLPKCPPTLAVKVIDEINHDKFVLAHYGANADYETVLNTLAGKNVFFDTSFTFNQIDKETFIKIMEKHGADKILFATDCPWQDIKDNLETFNSYGINKESADKILYKNAMKLLGIGE